MGPESDPLVQAALKSWLQDAMSGVVIDSGYGGDPCEEFGTGKQAMTVAELIAAGRVEEAQLVLGALQTETTIRPADNYGA